MGCELQTMTEANSIVGGRTTAKYLCHANTLIHSTVHKGTSPPALKDLNLSLIKRKLQEMHMGSLQAKELYSSKAS